MIPVAYVRVTYTCTLPTCLTRKMCGSRALHVASSIGWTVQQLSTSSCIADAAMLTGSWALVPPRPSQPIAGLTLKGWRCALRGVPSESYLMRDAFEQLGPLLTSPSSSTSIMCSSLNPLRLTSLSLKKLLPCKFEGFALPNLVTFRRNCQTVP